MSPKRGKVRCHFSIDVACKSIIYNSGIYSSAERHAARLQARAELDKLRELGFKTRYFEFWSNDEEAKERAKRAADMLAAEWESKSGIKMASYEGMFL